MRFGGGLGRLGGGCASLRWGGGGCAGVADRARVPTLAQGNGVEWRPVELRRTIGVLSSRSSSGSTSTRTSPSGRTSSAQRRSRSAGSPPIPMFPSISSTLPQRPSPGSRSCTGRCSADAPRDVVSETARGDTSTPSAGIPRSASAVTIRPGPHPMSSTGPSHRLSASRSTSSAGAVHRSTSDSDGTVRPSMPVATTRAVPPSACSNSSPGCAACCSRRYSRDTRNAGNSSARYAASRGVSMSRSVGSICTRIPQRQQPTRADPARCGRSTSVRRPARGDPAYVGRGTSTRRPRSAPVRRRTRTTRTRAAPAAVAACPSRPAASASRRTRPRTPPRAARRARRRAAPRPRTRAAAKAPVHPRARSPAASPARA